MPSPFPNAEHNIRGQTQCLVHESQTLKGNIWNDPHVRDVWVHLPRGYNKAKSYPLVVLLPAFAGTGEGLLARSLTDVSLFHRIDQWIVQGTCAPFVCLIPDCMTYLGGSQFLDSPAIGNYAQYITKELIPFAKEQYNLSNVAIMGHSSGGYGALHLAMSNPGLFSAVACHAGDMGFSNAYSSDLLPAIMAIHQAGGPKPFLEGFWKKRRFASSEFSAFNMLCMSAAYDPNIQNDSFPANLPFDHNEGTIDFDKFQSWERFDPLTLIDTPQHQEALKHLKHLYIECGSQDEYLLAFGARRFSKKLKKYSVPHTYVEFEGGHRGGSLRFVHSIPQLVHACSS